MAHAAVKAVSWAVLEALHESIHCEDPDPDKIHIHAIA